MREHIYEYALLDSTNLECRRLAAQQAPDGTVVIARQQTAGRGRRGRSFESPEGLGLYLSVLWRPEADGTALLPLTALCAVAVRRAVVRAAGLHCAIKWPNDLVLHGKKVAGILTESTVLPGGKIDCVIAGIGINIAHTPADFSPAVAAIASSLQAEAGFPIDRRALAEALIEELDTLRRDILAQPALWQEEYRDACLNIGQTVQLLRPDGSAEIAAAIGVDAQYGLTVEYADGRQETVRSGEVSVRGLYGYTT